MTISPSPTKRSLGSGFQLVTLPPGGPHALRLDAPFRPPHWTTRREGPNRPTYPGSALLLDGDWYEIVDLEEPPGLPRRCSFFLAPWQEHFPLRRVDELTPSYLLGITAAEREEKRRIKEAGVLRYMPVLLGLLPAEDQEALESQYGLSGNWNSIVSALFLLSISTFVLMAAFARSQGMNFGEWTSLIDALVAWVPLAAYLFLESVVRLAYTMQSREAIGSLPVAGALLAVRVLVNSFSPAARTRAGVAREPRASPQQMASARDRVRRLGDGRLEVLSRLPKKHWAVNVTGICYRGEPYFLDSHEVVETAEGIRHRFELVVPEREVLWKEVFEYHPEEVRDIYREERRLSVAMWVETFAFLWGFLDQQTQVRIERSFHFEPWNKTRWSLIIATAVSLWWLQGGVTAVGSGEAHLLDGLAFLAAIYLLWETAVRYRRLAQGEIRGSVVGWFLRPLVLPALRWGPKPASSGPEPSGGDLH